VPKFLLNWLLNAIAFPITARILDQIKIAGLSTVGGFQIRDFTSALIAALILGLVNSTIRPVIKLLTFPLTLITLGLSSLAINVLCLMAVAWYVPGFEINGIIPAILGSIILSAVSTVLHWFVK
jgi:putative membrane protein